MNYNRSLLFHFIFSLCTLFPAALEGQAVEGIVTDCATGDAIPFVNVWIDGTQTGNISNLDGKYSLMLESVCNINYSFVGYTPKQERIPYLKNIISLNTCLEPDVHNLKEVTIKPNYAYDKWMFNQILEHKSENREALNNVRNYHKYDRTNILLADNGNKELLESIKAPPEVLIKGKDSTTFIPIYLLEEDQYITSQGKDGKSEEVMSKKDGIFPTLNQQVESMVLEKVAIDFDFYKNTIVILDRGFTSPLSNNARMHYRIYLSDSTIVNSHKHYQFSFYPKNKNALLFSGNFWVKDSTFALSAISATLPNSANINFISDLSIDIKYKQHQNSEWFYTDQKLRMKVKLIKDKGEDKESNGRVFAITKTTQYHLNKLDEAGEIEMMGNLMTLDSLEILAYNGIKQLKENSYIKGVDKIGSMFLTSYLGLGKIDYGPFQDLYTTNIIEGNRLTAAIRTSQEMSEVYTIGGHIGYGFKSEEVKYGIVGKVKPKKGGSTIISASYTDEYTSITRDKFTQFIKENPFDKGNGNILASLTSSVQNPYVMGQHKLDLGLELQAENDIGIKINPYYYDNYTTEFVPFVRDGIAYNSFTNYGLLLNFRFSFNQKYDELYFAKVYYGNGKPVINFTIDNGFTVLSTPTKTISKPYYHAHLSVKNRFSLGQPFVRLMANVGYVGGEMPYTMLEKPSGTLSLGFLRYNYNLMYHASFAHNFYSNLHISVNGAGIIFNRVPLFSRLHMREILSIKSYYGARTPAYTGFFDIPEAFNNTLDAPYTELGLGVTNIFKVLRIEYVSLIGNSHAIGKYASSGGVRLTFEVSF